MRNCFNTRQEVTKGQVKVSALISRSRFWNSGIVYSVSLAMVLNPVVSNAGVAVDGGAPVGNRASISSAGNGVPIVDIVAPTAKGVSHNKFNQFNIDEQGLSHLEGLQELQYLYLGETGVDTLGIELVLERFLGVDIRLD